MNLTLYRKRFIPNECICLKDDVILKQTDEVIVTKWDTLNPKTAFSHGASCYFLKEGIKASKFFRPDGSLYCWYFDIVDYCFNEPDSLTVTDLLADVVIESEGEIRVLDLDELAEAFERGLIDAKTMSEALKRVGKLLNALYAKDFEHYRAPFDEFNL